LFICKVHETITVVSTYLTYCCLQWSSSCARHVAAFHRRRIHATHMGQICTELNDHNRHRENKQKVAVQTFLVQPDARRSHCDWHSSRAIQYCANVVVTTEKSLLMSSTRCWRPEHGSLLESLFKWLQLLFILLIAYCY